MVRDAKALNLHCDSDLIYFYKNAPHYADNLDMLDSVRVSDINTILYCQNIIEMAVLCELGEVHPDVEMRFLFKTLHKPDTPACASGTAGMSDAALAAVKRDGDALPYSSTDSGQNTQPDAVSGDSPDIAELTDNAIETAAPSQIIPAESHPAHSQFYINNLRHLLKPIIGPSDKNIVDLIFYLYQKKGVSYFDVLFEEFKDSKELLVELYLLVARGARAHSFNFTDIRETLGNRLAKEDSKDPKIIHETVDFFESSSGEQTLEDTECPEHCTVDGPAGPAVELSNKHIGVGTFIDDIDKVKPFVSSKIINPLLYLDEAKKILLDPLSSAQSFYIDNLSTYLSIRFDKELFFIYLHQPRTADFYLSLNKFEHPPFFFYKDCAIRDLLIPVVKLGVQRPKWVIGTENTTSEEEKSIQLQKHLLVANCYTLKHFIEYSMKVFETYNSGMDDYMFIAHGLHFFVEKCRHHALFRIFKGLVACPFELLRRRVYAVLCTHLSLYMDAFYNERICEHFIESGISLDNQLVEEWAYTSNKLTGADSAPADTDSSIVDAITSNITGEAVSKAQTADIGTSSNSEIEKNNFPRLKITSIENDTSPIKLPTLDDPADDIASHFTCPAILAPIDTLLSTILLNSYDQPTDRRAFIEKFLLQVCKWKEHRPLVIDHLCALRTLPIPIKEEIIALLCDVKEMPWRYRASLYQHREGLIALGVSPSWFTETFSNDRVFFIKHMLDV